MTAAYAYHLNAASPAVQSGRPHSILLNFKKAGMGVEELFPLIETSVWQRRFYKLIGMLRHRRFLLDREEALLRSFAEQLHIGLRKSSADFIFSPSTLPLSYLETDLPISFCADAPFSAMLDYYETFTRLTKRQINLSESLEASVIARAALSVYPSQWAADHAIRHYGASAAKVAVIPFGANFGRDNQRAEVASWIEQRPRCAELRLLFVGREWERKGGDLVVRAAQWLRARGLDVRVDIVGSRIPNRYRHLDFLHPHGVLSARVPQAVSQLTQLYQQAHFLFVPSRAEAYGMVFCEANAFGVPAIATATGGIPSVIRNGINGFALPLEAEAEHYGETILEAFEPRDRYLALAQDSFGEFEQRLNWDAFSRSFLSRMGFRGHGAAGDYDGPKASASVPTIMDAPRLDSRSGNPDAELATEAAPPLRIAFVADEYCNPREIGAWSGLPYFVWQALQKQGVELTRIALQSDSREAVRLLKFSAAKLLTGHRYLRDREPALLRAYARQIEARLAEQHFDFLFCPATAPIAYLKTKVPIAFWVDASFAGMLDFYESFSRLHSSSIREGHAADAAAVERSALAIYSSDWAAKSAARAYQADPARLHVVRFGANLKTCPTTAEIHDAIACRGRETCRLLLIGVDWKRKGADLAVRTLLELEKLGVKAQLTIIGCKAPSDTALPPNVEVLGFVSKGTEAGRRLIERHLRESHFFLMPSRAEAYGLVFCEASAFGLPCVATAVGGVAAIVEDGVNGWLLPLDAPAAAYAGKLYALWRDPAIYAAAARNGRRLFDERLNWDVAAEAVIALMRKHLLENADAGALQSCTLA